MAKPIFHETQQPSSDAVHTDMPTQALGGFMDPRVILVHGHDKRCARYWDETEGGIERSDDGPSHLIIGRLATDKKLESLSPRFGFTLEELKAFRDATSAEVDHG